MQDTMTGYTSAQSNWEC